MVCGGGGTGLPDADEFPLLPFPAVPVPGPPPNRVDLFGSRLLTGLVTSDECGPFVVLGLGVEGAWLF